MERGMSKNMQDTQVKEKVENRSTETSVRQAVAKSRFDEAEYQRWSEKLRSASAPKDK
jgi:hypothetical protein